MLKTIRIPRGLVLAALLSLFSAVIVRAGQTGAGAKKIDPCSLLTKAEIQAAVGQDVQDGKLNTKANAAVGQPCDYVVGAFGAFSLLVRSIGPGDTADKTLAGLKKMNMKTADAPGLGDRSFFAFPGYGMLQLNTFKGGYNVIMTLLIPGASEENQKAAAAKLMQTVLTRL